jgi:HK97 family phage prohead protease
MKTDTLRLGRFELKDVDAKARTFEGLSSTYDVDLGGDKVVPGAYKDTLALWKRQGYAIPLVDQHNYSSVRNVLGKMVHAEETSRGLRSRFRVVDSPDGHELLARLREGMIDALSIGYSALDSEDTQQDGRKIRLLKAIHLYEVSVVVFPMNEAARIDASTVKRMLADVRQDRPAASVLMPGDPRRVALEEKLRALTMRDIMSRAEMDALEDRLANVRQHRLKRRIQNVLKN